MRGKLLLLGLVILTGVAAANSALNHPLRQAVESLMSGGTVSGDLTITGYLSGKDAGVNNLTLTGNSQSVAPRGQNHFHETADGGYSYLQAKRFYLAGGGPNDYWSYAGGQGNYAGQFSVSSSIQVNGAASFAAGSSTTASFSSSGNLTADGARGQSLNWATGDAGFSSLRAHDQARFDSTIYMDGGSKICFGGTSTVACPAYLQGSNSDNALTIKATSGINMEGNTTISSGTLASDTAINAPGAAVYRNSGMCNSMSTAGAATCNTASGRSRIAATAANLPIYNSNATVNSVVTATLGSVDATCTGVKWIELDAGYITIYPNAVCTGDTIVQWWMVKP